ncbi:hypothetical protein BK022_22580 [Methylorubrum extorquens]|uniref:SGNH hydrolase-type esterase domain-containing protein n=1 Tax=Methylorubrum extorquens TaxID=408 RepID=A0A1S1P1G2_METEX|nr:hypothetical protein BK022_22580 [Methylorubrum extorquens]
MMPAATMRSPRTTGAVEKRVNVAPPRRRVRRICTPLLICAVALVTKGLPTVSPARVDRRVAAHAARRVPEILAALQQAGPDSILLAGNSHAELAGRTGEDCGVKLINAGVGGVRANEYATILTRLAKSRRMREAVLLIGTNDIHPRNKPLSALARLHFTAEVTRILALLGERADRITVAAVPPIGAEAVRRHDPAAVASHSDLLRGLCHEPRCRFVDPFEALRSQEAGVAVPGVLTDAIHLADYPGMLAALSLCPLQAVYGDRPPGSAASASGVVR